MPPPLGVMLPLGQERWIRLVKPSLTSGVWARQWPTGDIDCAERHGSLFWILASHVARQTARLKVAPSTGRTRYRSHTWSCALGVFGPTRSNKTCGLPTETGESPTPPEPHRPKQTATKARPTAWCCTHLNWSTENCGSTTWPHGRPGLRRGPLPSPPRQGLQRPGDSAQWERVLHALRGLLGERTLAVWPEASTPMSRPWAASRADLWWAEAK